MTSIVFALTKQQAKWGVAYQKKYSNQKVYIFAPTIAAQLVLLNAKISPFDYFLGGHFTKKYHTAYFWSIERKAVSLAGLVIRKLCILKPSLSDYFKTLQIPLEMSYLLIFETSDFAHKILALGNAKYIFFKQINKSDPLSQQLDLLAKYFLPHDNRQIIDLHENDFQLPQVFFKIMNNFSVKNAYVLLKRLLSVYKYLNQNQTKNIVFFSAGKNLAFYQKIIHLIKEDHQLHIGIITGAQSAADEALLHKLQIPFRPLSTFWKKSLKTKLEYQSRKTSAEIDHILKSNQLTKIFFSILSVNTQAALFAQTGAILQKNVAKNIRQAILAEEVMRIYKPNLVITTHDPSPSALPFALIAKRKNIQSIVFLHGWQDTIVGVKHVSDKIIVWSSYIKKWFIDKLDYPGKTIACLGYPLFDEHYQKTKIFWMSKSESNKLSEPIKLSLLLTQYLPHNALQSKFLHEFFSYFAGHKNEYKISIRLHAVQSQEGIQMVAMHYGLKVFFDQNLTLDQYIAQSDVVLSWDTSAIMWSMLYGKPTFYCSSGWNEGYTPVKKLGGAWITASPKDLDSKIKKLIENPLMLKKLNQSQTHFLETVIGKIDGKSSQNHYQYIKTLLFKSGHLNNI